MSQTSTNYLIIGNSAGGISAAEAIRKTDSVGTITIVSDEPYAAYSRILISKYLTGERKLEQTLLCPADFYDKNNITILLSTEVTKLDFDKHIALLADGSSIAWDKLLLAVGGTPITPKLEGSDKSGVFTFTKLDDTLAIKKYLEGGNKKAVVIGGGLIGLSVTEALVKCGVEVSIVEMQDRLLTAMVDEYTSEVVRKKLADAGVHILTAHTVTAVTGDDSVKGVTLNNGKQVPCDLVIMAIGVSPRLDLVRDTGLKLTRGIVVDRHMATNIADVYACGDVADVHDFVHEENRVTPIWPGAQTGGKIAGMNMAGNHTDFVGSTGMNTLGYFGLNIASGGIVNPPDDTYEVLVKKSRGKYQKIVIKDDKVVGMIFSGNIEKAAVVLCMMLDKTDVCDCKDDLLTDNACRLATSKWGIKPRFY
ncbi:MAG: NAD(P)/FAD-dependent oxidoreductase [Chloroflexi bacterium]|nr:NAD(P)/FAD-dependent oxidoreductase [Chloroflexota bacterium]MBT7081176.1 NAD(P)/FAD-dependent oxidoreductase [Chloroflexota bacterium]